MPIKTAFSGKCRGGRRGKDPCVYQSADVARFSGLGETRIEARGTRIPLSGRVVSGILGGGRSPDISAEGHTKNCTVMKFSLLLVLLWIAAMGHSEDEYRGWEAALLHLREHHSDLEELPKVEVVESHEADFIAIRVSNQSDKEIYYSGYSEQTAQIFTKRKVEGQWVPGGWSWCGTGMGVYFIQPGDSVTLMIHKSLTEAQVFCVFRTGPTTSSVVKLHGPVDHAADSAKPNPAPSKTMMPIRSRNGSDDPFK